MNRAYLVTFLLSISLGIGVWLAYPAASALYHLQKGGNYLDQVWSDHNLIPCLDHPEPYDLEQTKSLHFAITHLEQAAGTPWQPDQTYLWLGRAFCVEGALNKAIIAYREYFQRNPDHLAYLELGLAYAARGDTDKAKILWAESGLDHDVFLSVGNRAQAAGDPTLAMLAYDAAIKMNPAQGEIWLQMGLIKLNQMDYPAAEHYLLGALERGSFDSLPHLIDLYQKSGLSEKISPLYPIMIEHSKTHAERLEWWKLWGASLRDRYLWEDAANVYNRALSEFPDEVDFAVGASYAAYYTGESWDTIEAILNRALADNPESGILYYTGGELLSYKLRHAEADLWFKKAIESSPNTRWWYITRSRNAVKDGQLPLAINVMQDAVERFPDFSNANAELAYYLLLNGHHQDAQEKIEEVLSKVTEPWWLLYRYAGEIYEAVLDTNKAIAMYEMALQLEPGNQDLKSRLDQIKSDNLSQDE